MTKEEVIKKYGEIELSFADYYKYSFSYTYKSDNVYIEGSYGTNPDSIYKYECSADKKVKVKDLEDALNSLTILENGKEVFHYDDY